MPVATNDDLTGFGFSAHQSALIGANASICTTAGTSQGTATTMLTRNVELKTAGSQTGAIPPSDAKVMNPYFITCPTSTTGVVYVPSGHYLNSSQNSSVNVAQNKSVIFWQYKPKYWTYILTA